MLIFDFDGVLIDSLDEVTVSAYNAVTGMLVTALAELSSPLARLFQKNRFHFQPAGDVIPLMEWCLENYEKTPGKLLTPGQYQALIKNSPSPLLERTNQFYASRKAFVSKNKRAWLSLHRPYQPLWDALIGRGGRQVVILTNKNHAAVYRLCRHFGLEVPEKNIYAGDKGTTKLSNLHQIQRRFDRNQYELLDDSLKNLRELDLKFNLGHQRLSPILASWGYLGPSSKAEARGFQYRVFDQSDILAVLAKRLP